MSFGQIIFVLVIAQIIWRLKNGKPEAIREYPLAERVLASIVQRILIIGAFLMPIFGFSMAALSGNGVALFGLQLVARNPDPANAGEVIALNGPIAGFAHTAGALKHHVIDKDGTLRRMLGAKV